MPYNGVVIALCNSKMCKCIFVLCNRNSIHLMKRNGLMYKVAKTLFVAANRDVEKIAFSLAMRVCIRNMRIVSIVLLKMWNVQQY